MTKRKLAVIPFRKITTRGIIILAIIGLAVLFAAGCRPSAPTVPPTAPLIKTEYIGRVIDVNTQQAVVGAKIALDLEGVPPIVFTDNEGVYHFKVLISSTITGRVTVEAEGYQIYTRIITITVNNEMIADIRLTPLTTTLIPLSTFTLEPTSTFTPTPLPTSTLQVKTFAERCIFSETWRVHSSDLSILNSVVTKPNGCYDMGSVGIFADNTGVLNILDKNRSATVISGIDTPIYSDSVIEFKVFVNSMYLPDIEKGPLFASFAVASAADPLSFKNTARFKLQVETTDRKPPIIFVLADTGENNGAAILGQHYGYGNTYSIRLELTGNVMGVYINNVKMNEVLAIPVGPKVFYIGYNLPSHASMDIIVSDVKIDGVLK